MKKSQSFMVWLLPIIVIGGLFIPVLGFAVLAMMLTLIALSFFRGRYWCWNWCPRGAFLDIVMPKFTTGRPVPRLFTKQWFRWLIFALLITFLVWRLIKTNGNPILIASVFVSMCVVTTIVAIALGVITKPRGWCMICPMGTLQDKIGTTLKTR